MVLALLLDSSDCSIHRLGTMSGGPSSTFQGLAAPPPHAQRLHQCAKLISKGESGFIGSMQRHPPFLSLHARNWSPVPMAFDRNLEGRHEKRLPIAVVVCLTAAKQPPGENEQKTYTDNVSLHGARVISRHAC